MRIRFFLLMTLLLTSNAWAASVGGWREFQWGMTPEAAAKVAKAPLQEPEKGDAALGASSAKVITGFELGGVPFKGVLSFKDVGLFHVALKSPSSLAASDSLFGTLYAGLKEKYGDAAIQRNQATRTAVWTREDTTITLMEIPMFGQIMIIYQRQGMTENL